MHLPPDPLPTGHAGLPQRLRLGPRLHPSAFVVPNATVVGDVTLHEEASVWYGAVLRGDINRIVIGARSNLQDNAVIHLSDDYPAGANALVTVGKKIPPGSLVYGSPARVVSQLSLDEQSGIKKWALKYVANAKYYGEHYAGV